MAPEQELKDMDSMGWTLGKELGSGHFAKVYLVTRKADGVTAACKIIKKPKELKKRALVAMEHKIITEVDHPYAVKCYDAFETDDRMYLFMELMTGGELFDRIVDMGHFTEKMAQDVVYNLLDCLRYMHSKGIAHRDLKPENMLMSTKEKDAQVKITDFGLSKFFDEQSSVMKTPCGTPGYIAPEVLHMRGYDKQCDVWSMGVIVYILLCGFPPFYADNDAQLFEKIKRGEYQFLKPYWDPISDAAKQFVQRMLVVDPKKRATCEDLLKDPWLSDARSKSDDALHTTKELPAAHDKLKKLKGAFLATWTVKHLEHATADMGVSE